MAAAANLKNPKSTYLDNSLTNRYKIWHGHAIRHLWCVPQLELCYFKNPTWRPRAAAILKNRKIAISRHCFSDFNEIWHGDAVQPSWPFSSLPILDIKKSKMAAAGILTFKKIKISRQRFDRSAQHLAWWRILAPRTRRAIHESSYASFCA